MGGVLLSGSVLSSALTMHPAILGLGQGSITASGLSRAGISMTSTMQFKRESLYIPWESALGVKLSHRPTHSRSMFC